MTDIDALVERLDSHMGKAEVPDLLRDCRLARDAIRQLQGEIRRLKGSRPTTKTDQGAGR